MATVHLGKLQGASGSLLAVLVDGAQAAQWPGWDGNEAGRNRTLLAQWSETETGAEADVGSAGVASIWRVGEDIVLLDFFPDDDFDDESPLGRRQLAKRVEELPTRGKPTSQGFVQIASWSATGSWPPASGFWTLTMIRRSSSWRRSPVSRY